MTDLPDDYDDWDDYDGIIPADAATDAPSDELPVDIDSIYPLPPIDPYG